MHKELIKEIVVNVVGKHAEGITDLLDTKKHVNEFLIAKKLDITINQTRNILYKLSDFGLVSSIRKKDKKKGWYTYFWKFENLKALEFLKNLLEKKMGQLSEQINSRETKQFYICERCKLEFNEENALLINFTCDECGDVFILKDNTKVLKELRKSAARYGSELEVVREEIDKEREKIDKKRAKELEKEKKEKSAKRKAAAVARAKTRAKTAKAKKATKKSTKKTSKVKTVKKKTVKKTAKKKSIKKVVKKKTVKKKAAPKKTSKKTTKRAKSKK